MPGRRTPDRRARTSRPCGRAKARRPDPRHSRTTCPSRRPPCWRGRAPPTDCRSRICACRRRCRSRGPRRTLAQPPGAPWRRDPCARRLRRVACAWPRNSHRSSAAAARSPPACRASPVPAAGRGSALPPSRRSIRRHRRRCKRMARNTSLSLSMPAQAAPHPRRNTSTRPKRRDPSPARSASDGEAGTPAPPGVKKMRSRRAGSAARDRKKGILVTQQTTEA